MARPKFNGSKDTSANPGFEAKLWLSADKLRNNMDAAEYKHVVLGLIFLKNISYTFDDHHAKLVAGQGDFAGANPEDKDEYLAGNVFWVPVDARWPQLHSRAKLPSIGKDVNDASTTSRPTAWLAFSCEWQNVLQQVRRRRHPAKNHRGRPRGLHGRPPLVNQA